MTIPTEVVFPSTLAHDLFTLNRTDNIFQSGLGKMRCPVRRKHQFQKLSVIGKKSPGVPMAQATAIQWKRTVQRSPDRLMTLKGTPKPLKLEHSDQK